MKPPKKGDKWGPYEADENGWYSLKPARPRFPLLEELTFGIVLLFLTSGILTGLWVIVQIITSGFQ